EYVRIYHEALREKRSAGTVCVYLLSPGGKGIDSRTVATAAQPGYLQKMLEAAIKKLNTREGKALVTPVAQSTAPKAGDRGLVLHLISRYDHRGSWGEFPSENWIVLSPTEVGKWLPVGEVRVGSSWDIDPKTAAGVLTYFYPQTETCDLQHDTA